MWCGPETTKDKLSCSNLNAFEEVGVSSRTRTLTVITSTGNITIIKDGQNICTIKYKKWIPRKKVLIFFNALIIDIAPWYKVEMCKWQVKTDEKWALDACGKQFQLVLGSWLQNRNGGWRDGLFANVALKVTLHKSDHISSWCKSLNDVLCKAMGFY